MTHQEHSQTKSNFFDAGNSYTASTRSPLSAAPGLSGPPEVKKASQWQAMSIPQRCGLNSKSLRLFTSLHAVIKLQTAIAKCLRKPGTQEHANSRVRRSDTESRRESCHIPVGITLKLCWYGGKQWAVV